MFLPKCHVCFKTCSQLRKAFFIFRSGLSDGRISEGFPYLYTYVFLYKMGTVGSFHTCQCVLTLKFVWRSNLHLVLRMSNKLFCIKLIFCSSYLNLAESLTFLKQLPVVRYKMGSSRGFEYCHDLWFRDYRWGFWIFAFIDILQIVLQTNITLSLFPHFTVHCYTH
jgi:hypothetical protein